MSGPAPRAVGQSGLTRAPQVERAVGEARIGIGKGAVVNFCSKIHTISVVCVLRCALTEECGGARTSKRRLSTSTVVDGAGHMDAALFVCCGPSPRTGDCLMRHQPGELVECSIRKPGRLRKGMPFSTGDSSLDSNAETCAEIPKK